MIIEIYDTVRVFNQKTNIVEIDTWVKYRFKRKFPDFKRLNTISVCESNL